jgi:predicted nucleic acid-binding protein
MTVLFDSSVLIDLLTGSDWADRVADEMERIADDAFAINPLIYAEVSIPYPSLEELDADLNRLVLARLDLPWEAAFLAGRAFQAYKRRGGLRTSPMPDFYIGAHAVVSGLTLLTRDAKRYRTYFPNLEIIAPR